MTAKFSQIGYRPLAGPPEYVALADGAAPVSKPGNTSQCWGLVWVRDVKRWRRCESHRFRRPGAEFCTCRNHKKLEAAAQKLKAESEGKVG